MITLTTLTEDDRIINTTIVSLVVSGVDNRYFVEYALPEVLTRDKLPFLGGARQQIDCNRWPYLQGIDVLCMERSRIGIIIEQNCPEAVYPTESRKGLLGSPMAVHYIHWAGRYVVKLEMVAIPRINVSLCIQSTNGTIGCRSSGI